METTNRRRPFAMATAAVSSTVGLLAGALLAPPAAADSYVVSNLADVGPGSLRQAMTDAEARSGSDTVVFSPSLRGTIVVGSEGLPQLTESVAILGQGVDSVEVRLGEDPNRFRFSPDSESPQALVIRGLSFSGRNLDVFSLSDHGHTATLEDCVIRTRTELGPALSVNGATLLLRRVHVVGGETYHQASVGATGQLEVYDSTFEGSRAATAGGSIWNLGTLTVVDSVFRDNRSEAGGGAIYTAGRTVLENTLFESNQAPAGGALHASSGADVEVRQSSFVDNRAVGAGGGAIWSYDSQVRLRNVTVEGNSSTTTGGGIELEDDASSSGKLWLVASTISNNTAQNGGGGLWLISKTAVGAITNTALALNQGDDCNIDLAETGGHNLDSDGSCGFVGLGDHSAVADPGLTPLAWAGGQTPARLPLLDSPLVDNASEASCPPIDQRGFARDVAKCDIGAVELTPPELLLLPVSDESGPRFVPRPLGENEARSEIGVTGAGQGASGAHLRYAAVVTAALPYPGQGTLSNETVYQADYTLRIHVLAARDQPWMVPVTSAIHLDVQGRSTNTAAPERVVFGPVGVIATPDSGVLFQGDLGLPQSMYQQGLTWHQSLDASSEATLRGYGTGALQSAQLHVTIPITTTANLSSSMETSEASLLFGLPGSLTAVHTDDYPLPTRTSSEAGHFIDLAVADGDGLFGDGFESGDLRRWSSSNR